MRSYSGLIIPLFLLSLGWPLAATEPEFRLDRQVLPTRYSVTLTLTPGQDAFEATADIDLNLTAAASEIWMNATGLQIRGAALHAAGASATPKVQLKDDRLAGFLFDHAIAAGAATLHIEYSGKISNNSSAGVFQMKEANRWYLYTQFEPTDARRAFPCFDEPDFKTPWQLTLNVPKDQKAFSNTPAVAENSAPGGRKIVTFAATRPLPSYLVAFAVGPFDVADAGTAGKKNTPIRVIAPHGKAYEAKYAVATIPALLTQLEKYFGIAYPYEKLDSIAMPISNFAMENAGLITYGEELLLGDPNDDTSRASASSPLSARTRWRTNGSAIW